MSFDECNKLELHFSSEDLKYKKNSALNTHLYSLRFLVDFLINKDNRDKHAVDYFKGISNPQYSPLTNDQRLRNLFRIISKQRVHPSYDNDPFLMISDQVYDLGKYAKIMKKYYLDFFNKVPDNRLKSGVKEKAIVILNKIIIPSGLEYRNYGSST